MRPIDADKAFEIITDFAGTASTKSAYSAFWKSAKAIKAEPTIEMSYWISTNEEMPKEHETEEDIYDPESLAMLDTERDTCSDLVNIIVIENDTGKQFVCDDITMHGKWVNFPKELYTVTYWMPLPKMIDQKRVCRLSRLRRIRFTS